MRPKLFVALAGNIGAGKSTAARILSRHFDFELFQEPVLESRFLGMYYENMERWSFTLQMEFLLKRVEHHVQIDRLRGSCVQDRTLLEDPEVFAKYLHGLGHMNDQELDLYFDYFKRFQERIKQPDKVILLHSPDVNELLRRISERGRQEESGITADFLQGLNGYYDSFAQVARHKHGLDVLKLDISNWDIRRGDGKKRFLEQVHAFLTRDLAPSNELPFDLDVDADEEK